MLEHNGVRWINDSKATNVGSTEAALDGLLSWTLLYLLLGMMVNRQILAWRVT